VQVLHLILQCLSSLIFLLFGEGECLSLLLKKYPNLQKKVYICHKDELILVYTKQGMAIRSLKRSSMRFALEAVRGGKTRVVFSAGNTCSYIGFAKVILKTLPGIDRPAIVNQIPTFKGENLFLDLGGNMSVDCVIWSNLPLWEKYLYTMFLAYPIPK
jgi:glycerol-3-phosphate acyltransferase PlsX